MAIDLSGLTPEELDALEYEARTKAQEVRYAEDVAKAQEAHDSNLRLDGVKDRLDDLLGAEDTEPWTPGGTVPISIRALLPYTEAQLAQNSGKVLKHILRALEELTVSVRDLATLTRS